MRLLQPWLIGLVILPGTAMTVLPCSNAKFAVCMVPLLAEASLTIITPCAASSYAKRCPTSRPYGVGRRVPTIATVGARPSGSEPHKYKLFGGLAIVPTIWRYSDPSGETLLIFMTFYVKNY